MFFIRLNFDNFTAFIRLNFDNLLAFTRQACVFSSALIWLSFESFGGAAGSGLYFLTASIWLKKNIFLTKYTAKSWIFKAFTRLCRLV